MPKIISPKIRLVTSKSLIKNVVSELLYIEGLGSCVNLLSHSLQVHHFLYVSLSVCVCKCVCVCVCVGVGLNFSFLTSIQASHNFREGFHCVFIFMWVCKFCRNIDSNFREISEVE